MSEDSYSIENIREISKLDQLSDRAEYRDSAFLHKMRQQKGIPHAFCTDVDGTWIRRIELTQVEIQNLSSKEIKRMVEVLDDKNVYEWAKEFIKNAISSSK